MMEELRKLIRSGNARAYLLPPDKYNYVTAQIYKFERIEEGITESPHLEVIYDGDKIISEKIKIGD